MFLDYFALGVLILYSGHFFYGIIILHDIPYLIAKKRNHPHADAIHVAGWVSLFTLHVIWPFYGSGQRFIARSAGGYAERGFFPDPASGAGCRPEKKLDEVKTSPAE